MPMKIASMRASSGRTPFFNPTGRRICSCHLITSAASSSHEQAFWRILNRSPLRRKRLLSTTYVLKTGERAKRIEHIPSVLLHSGASASMATGQTDAEDLAATHAILQSHCDRMKNGGQIESGLSDGRWRVRYKIHGEPQVSIIIPSGGNTRNLRKNLDSIFDLTSYPNYEVVIIDNSHGDEVKKLVSLYIGRASSVRYIDWRDVPNFSEINNLAARQCVSPLLLFLNDDMSVIAPGWLDAMVEQAIRPGRRRGGSQAPASWRHDPACGNLYGVPQKLRACVSGAAERGTALF